MLLVYQAAELVLTVTIVMNLQIHLFALTEVMPLTLRVNFVLTVKLVIFVPMVL